MRSMLRTCMRPRTTRMQCLLTSVIRICQAFALLAIAAGAARADDGESKPGDELITYLARSGLSAAEAAPPRSAGEGPYKRLVLRGGILIDGTGAPPFGPVDIVIEGNRISAIRSLGDPKSTSRTAIRPAAGDRDLDVSGMYVLPGFVDAHAHIATPSQGLMGRVPPAEYVFKLWMGHGITAIRETGSLNGLSWTLDHKRRSQENEITAPRISAYAMFPSSSLRQTVKDPVGARRWVSELASAGADGIKFRGAPAPVMKAAVAAAKELGLRTACHHDQLAVGRMNVLDTALWGLTSMEHWYGLPEALFTDRSVQAYPPGYNYNNEQDRFREAGRLWRQAARPGSDRWKHVIRTLVELDFTLVPTLTIYEASRDQMRARRAEWHDEYTLPDLMRWFQPSRQAHGSYFFDWTTADEVGWKENYRLWMAFLNDYKNAGGRIALGSDAGYIYKLFGFAYIREMELLQEAGFHPLEVVKSATLRGAELLGLDDQVGSVEVGKLADLVVAQSNPLHNFKVLYGTGAVTLDDETQQVTRSGGIRWTIKDGVVYDTPKLLADVRQMVAHRKSVEAAGKDSH